MSLTRFFGLKWISTILVVAFTFMDLGYAQGLPLAQISSLQANKQVSSLQTKDVLSSLVSSQDVFKSDSKVQVDILQDFHCNFETQQSIYQYLNALNSQGQLKGVIQEGASGVIDLSSWESVDSSVKKPILNDLVQEGSMGGAERFAIENPKVPFLGAEEKELYVIHKNAYQYVLANQSDAFKSLNQLRKLINFLKLKIYPTHLLQMENDWNSYSEGEKILFFLKKYQHQIKKLDLSLLKSEFREFILLSLENYSVTPALLETELRRFAQDTSIDSFARESITKWFQRSLDEKRLTNADFIKRLIRQPTIFRPYQQLAQMLEFETLLTSFSPDFFFNQINMLYRQMVAQWMNQDEVKELFKLSQYLSLLEKSWHLELTPGLFKELLTLEESVSIEQSLVWLTSLRKTRKIKNYFKQISFFAYENRVASKAYYVLAQKRDKSIFNTVYSLTQQKSGRFVLVAGGFHGEQLAQQLKSNNISYQLLNPKFTEIDFNIHQKYTKAIDENSWVQSLDQALMQHQWLHPGLFSEKPTSKSRLTLLEARFGGSSQVITLPQSGSFSLIPLASKAGRFNFALLGEAGPFSGVQVSLLGDRSEREVLLSPLTVDSNSLGREVKAKDKKKGLLSSVRGNLFSTTFSLIVGIAFMFVLFPSLSFAQDSAISNRTQFQSVLTRALSESDVRQRMNLLGRLFDAELEDGYKNGEFVRVHSTASHLDLQLAIQEYLRRQNQDHRLSNSPAYVGDGTTQVPINSERPITVPAIQREEVKRFNPTGIFLSLMLGLFGTISALFGFPRFREQNLGKLRLGPAQSQQLLRNDQLTLTPVISGATLEPLEIGIENAYREGDTVYYSGQTPVHKPLEEVNLAEELIPSIVHLHIRKRDDGVYVVYSPKPIRYAYVEEGELQDTRRFASRSGEVLALNDLNRSGSGDVVYVELTHKLALTLNEEGMINFIRKTGEDLDENEEIPGAESLNVDQDTAGGLLITSRVSIVPLGNEPGHYRPILAVNRIQDLITVSALNSVVSEWEALLTRRMFLPLHAPYWSAFVFGGVLMLLSIVFFFSFSSSTEEKFTLSERQVPFTAQATLPRQRLPYSPLEFSRAMGHALAVNNRLNEDEGGAVDEFVAVANPLATSPYSLSDDEPYRISGSTSVMSEPILAPISGSVASVDSGSTLFVIRTPRHAELEQELSALRPRVVAQSSQWEVLRQAAEDLGRTTQPPESLTRLTRRQTELEGLLRILRVSSQTLRDSTPSGGTVRLNLSIGDTVRRGQAVGTVEFTGRREITERIPASLAFLIVNNLVRVRKNDGSSFTALSTSVVPDSFREGRNGKESTVELRFFDLDPSDLEGSGRISTRISVSPTDRRIVEVPGGDLNFAQGRISFMPMQFETAQIQGPIQFDPSVQTAGRMVTVGQTIGVYQGITIDGTYLTQAQIEQRIRTLEENVRTARDRFRQIGEQETRIEPLEDERGRLAVQISRNQETADLQTVRQNQQFRGMMRVLGDVSIDGHAPHLQALKDANTALDSFVDTLQSGGIVRREVEAIKGSLARLILQVEGGAYSGTTFSDLEDRSRRLFSIDLSAAPTTAVSTQDVQRETRRINGEIAGIRRTVERLQQEVRTLLLMADTVAVTEASMDRQVDLLGQRRAVLRENIRRLTLVARRAGRIGQPAPSGVVQVEVGQELIGFASDAVFRGTIPEIDAGGLTVDRNYIIRVGPIHIRAELTSVNDSGNRRGVSLSEVVFSIRGYSGVAGGSSADAVLVTAQSLGGKDGELSRRGFLGLCLAGLVGCVTGGIRDEVRETEEVPNSYSQSAPANSRVVVRIEVVAGQYVITIRGLKDAENQNLRTVLGERGYNVMEAEYRRSEAEVSGLALSDFGLQVGGGFTRNVEGDDAEDNVEGGGFLVITMPKRWGGQTFQYTVGDSLQANGIKSLIAVLISVKAIILNVSEDYSGLDRIAYRAAVADLDRAIVGRMDAVEKLIRGTWYIDQQIASKMADVVILRSEKTFIDRVLTAGANTMLSARRMAVESAIGTRETEIADLGRARALKVEKVKLGINISRDFQLEIAGVYDTSRVKVSRIPGTGTDEEQRLRRNQVIRHMASLSPEYRGAIDVFEAAGIQQELVELGFAVPQINFDIHRGRAELFQAWTDDVSNTNVSDPNELGAYFLFPDLIQLWSNRNGDAVRALLQSKRRTLEAVKNQKVLEIVTADLELTQAGVDLGRAESVVQGKERELLTLRTSPVSGVEAMLDDFAKQREINVAKEARLGLWMAHQDKWIAWESVIPEESLITSIRDFRFPSGSGASWGNNDSLESLGIGDFDEDSTQEARHGATFIQHGIFFIKQARAAVVPNAMNIQTRTVTVSSLASGSSLGSALKDSKKTQVELDFEDNESVESQVVKTHLELLQSFFKQFQDSFVRESAWVYFQELLSQRLSGLTALDPSNTGEQNVVLFSELKDLSENPEFLKGLLQLVELELFVSASSNEEARTKTQSRFVEGVIPGSVRVHAFSAAKPLYAAINQVAVKSGSTIPVVLNSDESVIKKLSGGSNDLIRVLFKEGTLPPEVALELARRIGSVEGDQAKIDNFLIGYNPQKQTFELIPIASLIRSLMTEVAAAYSLGSSA